MSGRGSEESSPPPGEAGTAETPTPGHRQTHRQKTQVSCDWWT